MNETKFRAGCIRDLEMLGYRVIAFPDYIIRKALGGYSAGYPDITAAGRGRVVFLECKVDTRYGREGLQEDQMQWDEEIDHAARRSHGAIYHAVATPENWDGIMEDLA